MLTDSAMSITSFFMSFPTLIPDTKLLTMHHVPASFFVFLFLFLDDKAVVNIRPHSKLIFCFLAWNHFLS